MSVPVLSLLIIVPLAGGLSLLAVSRRNELAIRLGTLAVCLLELCLSFVALSRFDKGLWQMQLVEHHPWIESLNISYALGVDGISVLFLPLTALITLMGVAVSYKSITVKAKEFFISLLLLESAMVGVFCATDLMLFYIFWEAMLIPMFLLIGVWGGPRRIYATVKFFLYTLLGSLLMLLGIITLYLKGGHTFDIAALARNSFDPRLQLLLFWAFFAAFAVKVPMWPVHTWLPDAHTEAPTAASVILAGVLIKMGAYGFLRFSLPLFPYAAWVLFKPMLVLSVIAIVYGALVCLAQTDVKRLIAYSSVSHMGFVTLGMFALTQKGVEGSILQMINHGIVTGALFLGVGMLYDRTHTREIRVYGGLASVMPLLSAFFMLFTLAAVGLPGTNGFVGEFLILLGGFERAPWAAVVASSGLILGAWYMLWLYQRVFFRKVSETVSGLAGETLDMREVAILLVMAVLIIGIGIFPNVLLEYMHASVEHLVTDTQQAFAAFSVN